MREPTRYGAMRWITWAVTLGLLCALAAWRMAPGGPLETNILTLLPGQHADPALAEAIQRSRGAFTRRLLAVVSGPDDAATRTAADTARATLLDAGMVASGDGAGVVKALAVYRAHPFTLLSPAERGRFQSEGARALATDVATHLASPLGLVHFGDDPGGYVGKFISRLPRPYPDFLPDGAMLSTLRNGTRVFLIRMRAGAAVFGARDAQRAANAVDAAARAVRKTCRTCRFEATGAALFANAARHEAKRETTLLTVVSTLLIMVLIALVYRSLAPHVLGFLQLFASVAAAGAAVVAVFGSINTLTLVFGTTLLGIAIDYAFLYFSEYWFGREPPHAVSRKIRSGLAIGLATGALAFAFLALTGFPALMQIAVFSVAGLLEAALVVVLIFPVTLTRTPTVRANAAIDWPARFVARSRRSARWRYIVPCVALLLCVPGWFQLASSDSVRDLSYVPPRLAQVDARIRSTLARFPAPGFFLIEGHDLNEALARETALFQRLGKQHGDVTMLGLSRFVPSVASQRASLAAWRTLLDDPAALHRAFAGMGLPPALVDRIGQRWHEAPRRPLSATSLLDAVPDLHHFVIRTSHGVALLATVFGNHQVDGTQLAVAAAGLAGVRYVEPLRRIADTFASVRVRAMALVAIGYLLIAGILLLRYGLREGMRMLYPPVVAMGITLGVMGWLHEPVSIFVVVALILILGLGRDYAVFLREVGAGERSPALAVTLSAMTTLLSFGLLALSRIPAVHAFGLAVGVGILASYVLTPLSLPPLRRKDKP